MESIILFIIVNFNINEYVNFYLADVKYENDKSPAINDVFS